jgi:hypothetical protein
MKKLNCWEFMHCERQPGGRKEKELGTCPVAIEKELDGAHDGIGAGRACWAVVGSFCGGKIQGTYAAKLKDCSKCEFMVLVKKEEALTPLGFSIMRHDIEKGRKESK